MKDFDPFREFEEPFVFVHEELDDGWHKLTFGGDRPPVPWRTHQGELFDETSEPINIARCYFWEVDKHEALEGFQRMIDEFRTLHAAELAEATLAHELDGTAGRDDINPYDSYLVWPVEQTLRGMLLLQAQWTNLSAGRDANDGITLGSCP